MSNKKGFHISLQDASIAQNNYIALQNVHFQVEQGEFVVILGATGSGKSSLLQTCFGQRPLQAGQGWMLDVPLHLLSPMTKVALRRQVALVSTQLPLLSDVSLENYLDFILAALEWNDALARRAQVQSVLELLELTSKRVSLARDLSRYEYILALVARALLVEPRILLVDDISQSLDVQLEKKLLDWVYQFSQTTSTTVVWASSRDSILANLPKYRLYKCSEKQLIELPFSQNTTSTI